MTHTCIVLIITRLPLKLTFINAESKAIESQLASEQTAEYGANK